MRRTWGRRVTNARKRRPSDNLLCAEQLEDRLTLSHGPLPGPEVLALSPFISVSDHEGLRAREEASYSGVVPQRFSAELHGQESVILPEIGAGYESPLPALMGGAASHEMSIVVVPTEVQVVLYELVVLAPTEYGLPPAPSGGDLVARGMYDHGPQSNLPPGMRVNPSASNLPGPTYAREAQVGDGFSFAATPAAAASATHAAPTVVPAATPVDAGATRAAANANLLAAPNVGMMPHVDTRNLELDASSGDAETPSETRVPANIALPQVVTTAATESGKASIPASKTEIPSPAKAALLPGVALNFAAVDQALDSVLGEVEDLGGELIVWFDELNVPPWALASTAAAVLAAGGVYYARRRGARSEDQRRDDEESSSWLFIQLQAAQGQL